MKNCTKIYLLTKVMICAILLISSCSNAVTGKYIGNLEFRDQNSSYSFLELKRDKSFTLRHETTSLEGANASTAVIETLGTYKMKFNKLSIETSKGRNGEIRYRLDNLKSYRVLFSGTNIPVDTFKVTKLIIPVDTVYGEYQYYNEIKEIKFKKTKSNNSIYFITDGAIFSKKVKSRKNIDLQLECPNLYEIRKAPDKTY